MISVAARNLDVSRRAVYNMIQKHPTVAEAVEEARERIIDVAEGQLFAQVSDGDQKAVMFLLRTLGRNRGYVERAERVVSLTDEELDGMTDEELRALAYGTDRPED